MLPLLLPFLISPTKTAVEPYLNQKLSPRARALDLVSKMTLAEKVSQMMDVAPAIPRLHIQRYNWWSESLHGVAKPGNVTVYPQVIGLGATFDTANIHEMAVQISDEERARWNYTQLHGDQGFDQGLDSWAPNINIFRDPHWGRGQETYGEDPFLTGRMAVHYINGLQGDDPLHFKTIATPKHYAVHDGPDPLRHQFNVTISPRDMWLTYLPAFQAAITEGHAYSIMGAYSAVNGIPDCANPYLLTDVLRKRWGFQGYVVSDCGAINDISGGHHYVQTDAEAAAVAVIQGCDLECGNVYRNLVKAVDQHLITEKQINVSVERLMEARIRLGMFDKNSKYDSIGMNVVDSDAHRALARKLAQESIVLLKNQDQLLPLTDKYKTIAVIGPNANDKQVVLGNYNGSNRLISTPLSGIIAAAPNAKVLYDQGCGLTGLSTLGPIPAEALHVKGEYFANQNLSGTPAFTRDNDTIDYNWADSAPADNFPQSHFSVRWTGTLTAPATGDYTLAITCDDGMRASIDGKEILNDWGDHAAETRTTQVHLIAGETHQVKIEYYQNLQEAVAKFSWATPNSHPFDSALAIANQADVIVAVLGISGELEGEEHDRSSLGLPEVQQQLLAALQATGKPIVLVYVNGGAISDPWSKANIPAIVEAWYPGEEGGNALGDVLFGKVNPSGRMPVTVVKSEEDIAPIADYNMDGRTYRFKPKTPLYEFGYGLSYSRFKYSNLVLPSKLEIGKDLAVNVTVTNESDLEGDEVVQAYLHHDSPSLPMPNLALKAFKRVHFNAHETKTVELIIPARELTVVHEDTSFWEEPESIHITVGGGQPSAATIMKSVELTGKAKLINWRKA